MFDDLKQAWREAVRNFRRELEDDDGADPGTGAGSMRRALDAAAVEAERLAGDIARTRGRLDEERQQVEVCRRREALARNIGDAETAGIAARFAERHAERVAVLERKLAALQAEHDLWRRDLDEMEAAVRAREAAGGIGSGRAERARTANPARDRTGGGAIGAAGGAGTGPASPAGAGGRLDTTDPTADAFRDLERAARERAAAERLEELKRRRR